MSILSKIFVKREKIDNYGCHFSRTILQKGMSNTTAMNIAPTKRSVHLLFCQIFAIDLRTQKKLIWRQLDISEKLSSSEFVLEYVL